MMRVTPESILAVMLVLGGAWGMLFQGRFEAWLHRRHQRRLAERLARGKDSYFEELRALEAYPPERTPVFAHRVGGALTIIMGITYLMVMHVQRN